MDFQPSKLEKIFPDKPTLTYFYIPYIPRSEAVSYLLPHADVWKVQGDDGFCKHKPDTVMNTSPEFQPYVAQQPQASQLPHTKIAIANPEQSVGTTEAATPTLLPQLDPATLVQYGGVTVAVILSITSLILVLAEYNKVFIPVMLQKRDEKNQ